MYAHHNQESPIQTLFPHLYQECHTRSLSLHEWPHYPTLLVSPLAPHRQILQNEKSVLLLTPDEA